MTRAELQEQNRAKVLAAARTEFVERGYRDAKVDDIAERAALTRGAVYSNFPGKRALYFAVLAEEAAVDEVSSAGRSTVRGTDDAAGPPSTGEAVSRRDTRSAGPGTGLGEWVGNGPHPPGRAGRLRPFLARPAAPGYGRGTVAAGRRAAACGAGRRAHPSAVAQLASSALC